MLKFNDFEALNEKASAGLPSKVDSLVTAIAQSDSDISTDPWPEKVDKEGERDIFLGLRMYVGDVLFRVNWKELGSEPVMIDVWSTKGQGETMPSFSLIGNYDLFRTIAPGLVRIITAVAREGAIPEKKKMKSLMAFEAEQQETSPRIIPAPPETTDDTVQPQSEFADAEFTVFDELRELVIMVINNVNPSLIITGRGGIGKTHTVMNTMKEFDLVKDEEYVVIKGASTALSMYKALYTNNGKIVIFDDCDSIFKDADGVNILKAALDSYEEREISWLSKSTYDPATQSPTESRPVPNRFIFDGQIIFISNMPMQKVDQAVRTRSYTIDISLSDNEVFNIMEKNLVNILPNVDIKLKQEVFNFMKNEYKASEEAANVRTLIKAIKIRLSGAPNWKTLASKYA